MLAVLCRDLVDDGAARLELVRGSSLAALRDASTPEHRPRPTFDGSFHVMADSDLVVDGLLLDAR